MVWKLAKVLSLPYQLWYSISAISVKTTTDFPCIFYLPMLRQLYHYFGIIGIRLRYSLVILSAISGKSFKLIYLPNFYWIVTNELHRTHLLPFKKFAILISIHISFLSKYISLNALSRPRLNLDAIWPLNSLFNL